MSREADDILIAPHFLVFAFSHQTCRWNISKVWNQLFNGCEYDVIWCCQAPGNPQSVNLELGST